MSTHTKSEQILAAIATLLAGVSQTSGRVYRSRQEAFARNEAPALVVEPGTSLARPEPVSTCKIDWTLPVTIAVYTRAAIPDQAASPIIRRVHQLLMDDRDLGGLAMDIWPVSHDPQFDRADLPAGWYVLTYNVMYRSDLTDLAL